MKLLILSQYFWPENFRINDVVEGLTERGHAVTVYTGVPNYPGGRYFAGYGFLGPLRERYKAAEVRRAPLISRGGGSGLRLALNFLSHAFFATLFAPWLARGRFDAILVYEPSPMTIGIPARALRALKRAPLLFWVQDLWPESLSATGAVKNRAVLAIVDRLIKWIYRGCDRVLVQSEAFIPSVEAHGVPRSRIRYLPNSAENFYRRVAPQPTDVEARELPSGFRVMYAGNIGAAQDFPTILAAAELLKREGSIQWIVLGEGRMRSWVEEEVRRRGLQGSVHLLGQRPPERMSRYFAHADVLLATLRREPIFAYTIPSKIQAYIACGKPVIAALEGEGGRNIREAGAGWVVPPEDPRALADAVIAASRLEKSELSAMGQRGEAWFREHFERDKLLSRLEAELEEDCEVKVLILGGAGMLGHELLRELQPRHDTHVTLRQSLAAYASCGLFNAGNSYSDVDVCAPGRVEQVLTDFRPAVVVNAVGIVKQRPEAQDSILSIEVNSLLPHRLTLDCRAVGARLIHLSTDCVFSGERGGYSENDRPDPLDLYDRSKLLGEVSASNAVTLRTSMIGLGLYRKTNLVDWFLAQKGRVQGYRNAIFSGLTTAEISRVIATLIEKHAAATGLYHLSAAPISKLDLLTKLRERLSLPVEIVPVDEPRIDRSLDSTRFRKAFGYQPPSWDRMLDELAQQVRAR